MFSSSFHKKYLANNTESELSNSVLSNNEDIYYKKYLTYKQKYINLKSQKVMTGGASNQN
jgi:hypothetical protein